MWLRQLQQRWLGLNRSTRRPSRAAKDSDSRRLRPVLECLEDRTLLSTFTAATVADLIADINAANAHGGDNTINLTASSYILTAADNTTDGPTDLPVIVKGDQLTIEGNGATIQAQITRNAFRIFDVADKAALTLNDLTLTGGIAFGSGVSAEGGGIFSRGQLTLDNVTVTQNFAAGTSEFFLADSVPGKDAAGGGIFSVGGSITLKAGTVLTQNEAVGGNAGIGLNGNPGGAGGNASGGGLFAMDATVLIEAGAQVSSNLALAGFGGSSGSNLFTGAIGTGGASGNATGGGITAIDSNVTINGTLLENQVDGNRGGSGQTNATGGAGGNASGGGLYAVGSSVSLNGALFQGSIARAGFGGGSSGAGNASGNGGSASGGGIAAIDSRLTLNDTIIEFSETDGAGGGSGFFGENGDGGTGSGGGLFARQSEITLINVIVQQNGVSGGGGGYGFRRRVQRWGRGHRQRWGHCRRRRFPQSIR